MGPQYELQIVRSHSHFGQLVGLREHLFCLVRKPGKVDEPGKLRSTIAEALACEGPAIVDAVVAADELPNLPHVNLAQIGHFAQAKIREAILAVTG